MVVALLPLTAQAVTTIDAPPLKQVIRTPTGAVNEGPPLKVPLITWGGDIATILANGNAARTAAGSIFSQKGLDLELVRVDDFKQQVQSYLKGETPFLRGTMGMIHMAADVVGADPQTRPVVVYQMTWSNGGDCLVVKPGIGNVAALKGKTIAVQAYGPHVAYLAKALRDAGLSMRDVTIRWLPDLTGTDNTPMEAFYGNDVDAAFVIIPDGLTLTSGGNVGNGAEGSVKGARILMSTKTANRIIADVYAVRSDFFQAHRDRVRQFVHGLLLAEQQLKAIFKDRQGRMAEFKPMITAAASILLDSPQATADAEALYADCQYVGFRGNVDFFGNPKWPRSFERITEEVQSAFVAANLITARAPLDKAQWDYDQLREGLLGIDDVASPRFKTEEVAKVVTQRQAQGTLGEGQLFSFEINFKPNQKVFSEDLYQDAFDQVVELASAYGGAVITVEGHSDPLRYRKLEKQGADEIVLRRTMQAAKNLSMSRAIAVRDSVIGYARQNGLPLDNSQFTVLGHGISQPKYATPRTQQEWLDNMRVVFRIIQIEAEETVFEPLN
jgi:ABC-type nitrate/sulfonate/bicarbonate transport system substrate-binding protein/outer membrane protein OmpA-like peptidoglycan-associated protein